MKKNLFKSVLSAFALGAVFAACSSDNDVPTVDQGSRSVFMKLELPAISRAVESALTTGATATVNDLHLYFHDGTNIQKYVAINASSTPSITQLASGAQIPDIPVAATHVTVYGNKPASLSLPTAGTLVALKATQVDILTQNVIANVFLKSSDVALTTYSGTGAPSWASTIQNGDKFAEVEIIPTVARIEIAGIQADATSKVGGFDLQGIYLNNYYPKFRLDGDNATLSLTNNGATPSVYVSGGTEYPSASAGKTFDESTIPASGSPLQVVATGGGTNRWAYQVAPNAATAANDQLQLLFKLGNLTPTPSAGITFPSGSQFVTVRGFLNKATSTPVTIEPGKVYTVEAADFKFDENNLTTVPVVTAVGVWLKVTVKSWEVVAVKPNI